VDSKVKLLKRFFSGMQMDKLKLESRQYGFDFLSAILVGGCSLEYGQLADGLIHKYKLLDVSQARLGELLHGHISGEYNVCCYFHSNANTVCCFNLDSNLRDYDYRAPADQYPEVRRSLKELSGLLRELGLPPLVTVSGRGYHLRLRFEEAVPNQQLFDFSIRVAAKTLEALHKGGYDYGKVKITVYPNPEIIHTGSLRLFGCRHVQNKVFSHVLLRSEILDEESSWDYFADYLQNQTSPLAKFNHARDEITRFFVKHK
jgi:hypothetical protein